MTTFFFTDNQNLWRKSRFHELGIRQMPRFFFIICTLQHTYYRIIYKQNPFNITACVNKSASLKEHFCLRKLYVSFVKVYNNMIGNIISFYRIFVLYILDLWFRSYGKSCKVPPNLFGLIRYYYRIHHG